MSRRSTLAYAVGFGVLTVAILVFQTGAWVDVVGTGEYQRTTVTAIDDNGTKLATVEVRIADSFTKRYAGLSDVESLGSNEGMLFVHENEGTYTYVMRGMSFPLDIIFVDANGTVTAIYHARAPPDGVSRDELTEYRATGKYVLEVDRGWANAVGLDVGDRVTFPGMDANESS